jgi:hypothetical protein
VLAYGKKLVFLWYFCSTVDFDGKGKFPIAWGRCGIK